LVVEQIVVADEQITIKHVIPLSDVRLQRQYYFYKFIPGMIVPLTTSD
jgi:hypothetical protein